MTADRHHGLRCLRRLFADDRLDATVYRVEMVTEPNRSGTEQEPCRFLPVRRIRSLATIYI